MGGTHVHITTQNVILAFSSQPTHSLSETPKVNHTKFIRNTNPFVIRDTSEISYFLILKDITYFYQQENKTNYH